jgi:hypothetical protein
MQPFKKRMVRSLNVVSALFALAAAAMWFLSAVAQVKAKDVVGPDGWIESSLTSDGNDVIESGKAQQKWSRRGAFAASVAAFFQAAAAIA